MLKDDELIHPNDLEIGQTLNVISGGASDSTILTGKRIGDTCTLVCGTVRLDLTKII